MYDAGLFDPLDDDDQVKPRLFFFLRSNQYYHSFLKKNLGLIVQ